MPGETKAAVIGAKALPIPNDTDYVATVRLEGSDSVYFLTKRNVRLLLNNKEFKLDNNLVMVLEPGKSLMPSIVLEGAIS